MLPASTTAHSLPPTFMRLVLTLPSRLSFARPGDRLAAQDPGGVLIEDEAAAEPFRLAATQPQAMRHAGAREPVVAHEAHPIQLIDRVGADPEKAAGQLLRDTADHLQVEGRDFALEGREVPRDVRRAGAACRGDFFCRYVHLHLLARIVVTPVVLHRAHHASLLSSDEFAIGEDIDRA